MTGYMYMDDVSNPAEREKMERIKKDGVCPFCPGQFIKYHDSPLIKEGNHWYLAKNDFPYEGSALHLLFVHKAHIHHLGDMSDAAAIELISLMKFVQKEFSIPNGLFIMRFGDPQYSGATINHLHGHVVVAKDDKESRELLKNKISF